MFHFAQRICSGFCYTYMGCMDFYYGKAIGAPSERCALT